MEPDDYRVTIRLSPHLYAQLEARGSHGQPLAAIVREALEAFLAQPRQIPADMAASLAALQVQVEQLTSQLAALAAMRQQSAAIPATQAAERQPTAARRPTPPATPESPTALTPHLQRIAEVAAEYDKLSLAELAQLLFDRNIYRARDRRGEAVPVNRGTLKKWLDQARAAGAL